MNLLKQLFKRKATPVAQEAEATPTFDSMVVERVIEMLQSNPNCFSARWSRGDTLDASVRSKNGQILIMTCDGAIILPIKPKMTFSQRARIQQLIAPIVERDTYYVIDRLSCK